MEVRICLAVAAVLLAGCSEVQQYGTESVSAAPRPAAIEKSYRIATGDKVRITVYNEPTLTGEFPVGPNRAIAYPLIGDVPAVGLTSVELAAAIQGKLSRGYLNIPIVSAEVSVFRPFYILGEVNHPGEYPYTSDMTVLQAIASAQGFTYRADKRVVLLKRSDSDRELPVKITPDLVIGPGDTLRIKERYF